MIFPWKWWLKNKYPATGIKYHGSRVFSCFCCGGGSTMGYKLAGYNVIGGLEVDSKIADIYIKNHNPKIFYNKDIRDFLRRGNFPKELYNLDILDGSPPCTSFSLAGVREKGWGVKRKYNEGRIYQVLNDLFLVFINVIKKLHPKIAVIENVPGLNIGIAKKKYMPLIGKAITNAGYDFTFKILDSSKMGVPQKRRRIFFLCVRKDIKQIQRKGLLQNIPVINLKFNQKEIPAKDILDENDKREQIETIGSSLWKKCKIGDYFSTVSKSGWFQQIRINTLLSVPTLCVSSSTSAWHPNICRPLNKQEWINTSSFPQDYEFNKQHYHIIGNSVPPIMMANLAHAIYNQWIKKI